MASKVLVRVEARRAQTGSYDEGMRECQFLLKRFKRACQDYGISHLIKEKEHHVRPCDKRRTKESRRRLTILRANNPQLKPQKPVRSEQA